MDETEGTSAADRRGIYVYCFALPAAARNVDAPDMDGGRKVDVIESDGVGAVCSRVSLESFTGAGGEAHLKDPAWVVPRVCRHEEVVEQVMAHSPVLPVRFGAVFSSEDALAAVMDANGKQILSFLEDVCDKEEWSVKATVNPKTLCESLLGTDDVLADRRKRIPLSPGAGYLHEKRLRAEARKRWKTHARTLAGQILDVLSEDAEDVCLLTPRSADASPGGEEMILNSAFLLLRDHVGAFRDQAATLGEEYVTKGVSLDVTGPWPPYSFCPAILAEKEMG